MRRLTGFIRRRGDADMPAETGQRRAIRLPRWRSLAYGLLAVFVTGSAAAVIAERQRLADMLIVASAETGLQLEYIEVYGRAHTPKEAILAASELTLGEPCWEYRCATCMRACRPSDGSRMSPSNARCRRPSACC